MSGQAERAERFLALHSAERPLLLPNPWDLGSARLFESLGFEALATTSSGFAMTLGRLDGSVSREEAIAHAASIAAGDRPAGLGRPRELLRGRPGRAWPRPCGWPARPASREPRSRTRAAPEDDPVYELGLATERVAAAAEAAHAGEARLVLTARAENHLYGAGDLADTIARLQAYQEAGADVLFAPGLRDLEEIRRLVDSVERPVNVLARPDGPSVAELASAGVSRVSVGGAFAFAALGAAVEAARELIDEGTCGFWERSRVGVQAAKSAFAD